MSDQVINKYNFTSDAMIRQAERIGQATGATNGVSGNNVNTQPQDSPFKNLLDQTYIGNEEVSFSKHAAMRTQQRNINLTSADVEKLGEACSRASQKGIKEALVVMNESAFIVNAPNKTVITVVDKNEMKENVVTHIDGALFI